MPVVLSTSETLPTNMFILPIAKRETIGLSRRRHVRRKTSVPTISEVVNDIPGVLSVRDPPVKDPDHPGKGPKPNGKDTETPDEETADDESTDGEAAPAAPAPEPAPAAPLPSTNVAISTAPASAPPASAETSATLPSSAVPAVAESVVVGTTTIVRSFFLTTTLEQSLPTETPPTTTIIINPVPPTGQPTTLATSTLASGTGDRPGIVPTNPTLPYDDDRAQESKTAVTAAVSIISISLFFGIVYCLARFCPPVRSRWAAFMARRRHDQQKRMGINESPLPPPVIVVNGAPGNSSTWATGGLGVRNVGIEHGVLRPLSEPHLRPPSYRSHWTASGGSWVANGFWQPDRVSQRMMRWSDRSARSRFMGRGQRISDSESSISGVGLVADGPMRETSRISRGTAAGTGRASEESEVSTLSRGSDSGSECGRRSGTASRHSQARFSTNARISDMSSLSAGTTSNASPPPLPFIVPIGVARGSGSG